MPFCHSIKSIYFVKYSASRQIAANTTNLSQLLTLSLWQFSRMTETHVGHTSSSLYFRRCKFINKCQMYDIIAHVVGRSSPPNRGFPDATKSSSRPRLPGIRHKSSRDPLVSAPSARPFLRLPTTGNHRRRFTYAWRVSEHVNG